MGDEMLTCRVSFYAYTVQIEMIYQCYSKNSAMVIYSERHQRSRFFIDESTKSVIAEHLRQWHLLECEIQDALDMIYTPLDEWEYTISKAYPVKYRPQHLRG